MAALHITNKNFKEEVLNSDKLVLIDFWASWCGPCMMVSPIVDEIAEEHPEYTVCKVNVDEEGELAAMFNIMSIPTLMVFKNGKPTTTTVGVRPKEAILEMLK